MTCGVLCQRPYSSLEKPHLLQELDASYWLQSAMYQYLNLLLHAHCSHRTVSRHLKYFIVIVKYSLVTQERNQIFQCWYCVLFHQISINSPCNLMAQTCITILSRYRYHSAFCTTIITSRFHCFFFHNRDYQSSCCKTARLPSIVINSIC